MYKVKNIRLTCEATPSQWEGRTTNGKYIYIRYRFGSFSACVGDNENDAVCGYSDQDSDNPGIIHCIYWQHPTNMWDGTMTTKQMMHLTREFLDFEGCVFESDLVKFYIYDLPKDEIIKQQPIFAIKGINPSLLGEKVEVNLNVKHVVD